MYVEHLDPLEDMGLVGFTMLLGGKGVHVMVPLEPGHLWGAHKDFARRFTEAWALAKPERFVVTISMAKREGLAGWGVAAQKLPDF